MKLKADDDFWLDDCAQKNKDTPCCDVLSLVKKLYEKFFLLAA